MATREEVYSLFGVKSPAQVRAEQEAQFSQLLGGASGAQQAGLGLGALFGKALGAETAQERQSRLMTEALQGVDPNDPVKLRELAKTVSSFAPEAALRMLAEAKTLETPETKNIYQKIKVPVLNAITGQPTGQFEEKSIMRTAVYKQGKFAGYQDEQGNVVPASADSSIGILDTPEAKANRAQAESGAVDLGGGVRLKLDGKTAVTDDQLEAARAGTPSGTAIQSGVADDGGAILPADKFPVEQGTADIQRGITTVAESDLADPVSRRFTTTQIQNRDDAIDRLQQEDTSKLLGMLKALENQPTLTTEDQELLRMLTATLAERRKAPQQQQR